MALVKVPVPVCLFEDKFACCLHFAFETILHKYSLLGRRGTLFDMGAQYLFLKLTTLVKSCALNQETSLRCMH